MRPATSLGVPYSFAIVELLFITIVFVGLGTLWGVVFVVPVHVALVFLNQDDPYLLSVLWVSFFDVTPTRNKRFWEGNSYIC